MDLINPLYINLFIGLYFITLIISLFMLWKKEFSTAIKLILLLVILFLPIIGSLMVIFLSLSKRARASD